MSKHYPRIIIAGFRGGSGKTVLSLGLTAAFRKRGLRIAPYKKGPDYIDAGWLNTAAEQNCYNLDQFLTGKKRILRSFQEHFGNADCAIIEGNRGLYDGVDVTGTFSTAELSKILKAPVILIIDCTKVTRTAGAMVFGMQRFDRTVRTEGVILNRVAGTRHEDIVRKTIKKYCRIPVLGAVPKLTKGILLERHMGLTPFQEHPDKEKIIAYASDIAEQYLDLDRIYTIARHASPLSSAFVNTKRAHSQSQIQNQESRIVIGIIRDSAFQFYYPDNFEELEKRGARLVEISALSEHEVGGIDALYIGGGFPETHAIALAENTRFRKSLQKAVERGLPVYAECGGLIYLGKALRLGRKTYPMAGIFPVTFSLEKVPQAHGYTVVEVKRKNPFYNPGTVLKGHEFHYSRVVKTGRKAGVQYSFMMKRGQGIMDKLDGLCYRNVLATYTHIHALGTDEWADGLIRKASKYRKTVKSRK
jgi:cobyrinic acid a,c-diamide synthase